MHGTLGQHGQHLVAWRSSIGPSVVRRISPVSAGMGDCLRACNQANYVNSALHPSGVAKSSTSFNRLGQWRECHLCRVAGNTVRSHMARSGEAPLGNCYPDYFSYYFTSPQRTPRSIQPLFAGLTVVTSTQR